jgi:hypothetical protein
VDPTDRGPKGLFRTQRERSARLRGYESGKRTLLRCVQAHFWLWDSLERAPLTFLMVPASIRRERCACLDAFNQVDCPAKTRIPPGRYP